MAKRRFGTVDVKNLVAENQPNKNFLINGGMDIWQRNTDFNPIGNAGFGADRWQVVKSGGVGEIRMQRSTDIPTQSESDYQSTYSMRIAPQTADGTMDAADNYYFRQGIEGYNSQEFYGKEITLSFWVKSNKPGTYCLTFGNNDVSRMYITEYTIDASNTWEKKTITLTHDLTGTWQTTTSAGMYVFFMLGLGSNFHGTADTWNGGFVTGTSNQTNFMDNTGNELFITQVKLELGSQATRFKKCGETFQDELAKCQRYFETSYAVDTPVGTATNSGAYQFYPAIATQRDSIKYSVTKRQPASLQFFSPDTGAGPDKGADRSTGSTVFIVAGDNGENGFNISTGLPGSRHYAFHWTATSEI